MRKKYIIYIIEWTRNRSWFWKQKQGLPSLYVCLCSLMMIIIVVVQSSNVIKVRLWDFPKSSPIPTTNSEFRFRNPTNFQSIRMRFCFTIEKTTAKLFLLKFILFEKSKKKKGKPLSWLDDFCLKNDSGIIFF